MDGSQQISNEPVPSVPEEMQRTLVHRCLSSTSASAQFNLSEVRKLLERFPGGKVDVVKNEQTGIATICLNRPDKKNALGGQILLELESAADALAAWPAGKGFLLHGSNNFFCSGGDLAMSYGTSTFEEGLLLAKFAQRVFNKLKTLPLVSAAFIEKVALGGGAELSVAACDWRLLHPEATIGFVHTKMAITPGWGGAAALRDLVGPSRALEIICSGRLVAAEEAVNIGLATDVISDFEGAVKWLEARTAAPLEVVRACKEAAVEGNREIDEKVHATLWASPAKIEVLRKRVKHL